MNKLKRLVFDTTYVVENKKIILRFCAKEITDQLWGDFVSKFSREEHVYVHSINTFKHKLDTGCAAVALHDGRIISYISFTPLPANLNHLLSKHTGVKLEDLPDFRLYESASGWTDINFRNLGLSFELRKKLIERFSNPKNIFISVTIGIGAAPVLDKLGWRLISWDKFAFLSSLNAWYRNNEVYKVGVGWLSIGDMEPYNGVHISFKKSTNHDWNHYCHLWVSDTKFASKINRQISSIMKGNLKKWREAIALSFSELSDTGNLKSLNI